MDRLVCGDVGFGKTEIAIRAAFKAVDAGRQVAILVPTTVLCEQHERSFRDRFRGYPFRIESLSRFKTDAEQNATLEALGEGKVDVVIGTHRLLSKDVRFRNLGLVIVDEEQRFGVEHKTRLLEFRVTADVLTLSATPIPRTLHMAMLGLRDISSLTTAPADRRAIVTEVIPSNERRVQQAILRELAREGQVFFVHNRIGDLQSVADDLQRLAPGARIVVGHGQMVPKELEDAMLRFMRREADILVSTTIIESGIDIPTANTIIIDNAHMFGLAELHQLRGRVGRWKHRAYCYLLLPKDRPVRDEALKRLHAVEEFSMLGAGFRIAMRDLELRGAGNILGEEQSGHIAAVGYEMYCQLLEQAVGELRNEVKVSPLDTVLDIGLAGSVPKGWIPSDARRMEAYRRIGQADTLEALARVVADLESAYGEAPATARTLFEVAEIRLRAATLGIRSIARKAPDVIFRTTQPRELERRLAGVQGAVRIVPTIDGSGLAEVFMRPPKAFLETKTLAAVLRKRLAV
jgi:transcription-repair coupling factor (superfamily II helicase)